MAEGGPIPSPAPERRRVPAGGLEVWDRPGGVGAARHRLEPGTDVEVLGRRGHWVHVRLGEEVDGWADGLALAGVAVGVHPTAPRAETEAAPGPASEPAPGVPPGPAGVAATVPRRPRFDDRPHRFTLARGPLVGALAVGVVVLGAGMSWHRVSGASAFELGARHYLLDWGAPRSGREIGWLLVYLTVPAALLSLVRGAGWIRRVAGLTVIVICALYVLQWQDVLNAYGAGLGSGRNVWDVVDVGTVVTFAGGVGMAVAPVR